MSDLLKIAFLRSLAGLDRRLGVAWYYVPLNDGRTDGRHLEWRQEDAWRKLDRPLYEGFSTLPLRAVEALEQVPIWPDATSFHRSPVPVKTHRETWATQLREALDGSDLVFLDPDNGLGKVTKRHATMAELKALRRPGRALAFITFPGRTAKHNELVRRLHTALGTEAGASDVFTIRTSVSVKNAPGGRIPRLRWFTVIDPDEELRGRAREFGRALLGIPGVRVETSGL